MLRPALPGAPSGIRYTLATPDRIAELAQAAGGYRSLLGAEAAAASRYRHAEDAAAYLASRTLLRLLTGHLLGEDPARLPVTRSCRGCGGTDHGKPQVPGLEVSMSRTRALVLAAAGPAPLGADVELVPDTVFEGFDGAVLSPLERTRTDCRGMETARDCARERMRIWTAKEAALKVTGHGLGAELTGLSVLPLAAGPFFNAVVRCTEPPGANGLRIGWLPAGDRHLAALACAQALPVVEIPAAELMRPRS